MIVFGVRGRSSIRSVACPVLVLVSLSASRASGAVGAAPEAVTPLAAPATPTDPRPIEMRDVTWGGRSGELHHKPVPFRGNLILDDVALFRLLGRDDLLRAYEQRTHTRNALTVLGLLTFLGAGFALAEARPKLDCAGSSGCRTEQSEGALAAGVALLVAGASLMVADATFNVSPISDGQRAALVDDYNRTLANPAPAPNP